MGGADMTTATPRLQLGFSLSDRSLYIHREPGVAAIQDTPTIGRNSMRLRFGLTGLAPDWLPATIQRLNQLLMLHDDWDSEGARKIELTAVTMALQLIILAANIGAPQPTIGPTVEGELQVEWHMGNIDLEIETLASGRFDVLFEDRELGDDWEAGAGLNSPAITVPLTVLARRS